MNGVQLDQLRRRVALAVDGEASPSPPAAESLLEAHRAVDAALRAELQALGTGPGRPEPAALERVEELRRLGSQLVERSAIARLQAAERVRAALHRLVEVGPVAELLERGPPEAAGAIPLDRVLLSRVDDGRLVAESLHEAGEDRDPEATLVRLRELPAQLEHPLLEAELARRRRPAIVRWAGEAPTGRHAHGEVMGWHDYVAAPVVLEGRVVGFFQGDRPTPDRPLGTLDRDALWQFAQGFAEVFERAILRRRLRLQRQELRQVASWADARTSELDDGALDLTAERDTGPAGRTAPAAAGSDPRLRELLTRRELEVLEHMVRGETNAGIARELVVSEGTVKFHVKNVLRKLHAANRAEATSRYLRLTLQGAEAQREPGRPSRWFA